MELAMTIQTLKEVVCTTLSDTEIIITRTKSGEVEVCIPKEITTRGKQFLIHQYNTQVIAVTKGETKIIRVLSVR